jgi:two-component system response regulator MprA
VRILVVDDDPGVRESLRRSLIFNGYDVELAEDGQRALSSIALRRPDAVVLDVMMPGLDGLETCRRLRAAGEDLPVLMLTTTWSSPSHSTNCSHVCARFCGAPWRGLTPRNS